MTTDSGLYELKIMREMRDWIRTSTVPTDCFVYSLVPEHLRDCLSSNSVYSPIKYKFHTLIQAGRLSQKRSTRGEFPSEHELLKSISSLSHNLIETRRELDPDGALSNTLLYNLAGLRQHSFESGVDLDSPENLKVRLGDFEELEPGSFAEHALNNSVTIDEVMRAKASRWSGRYRELYGVIAQLMLLEGLLMELTRLQVIYDLLGGSKPTKPMEFMPLTHRGWRDKSEGSVVAPLIRAFNLGLIPGVPFNSLLRKLCEMLPHVVTNLSELEGFALLLDGATPVNAKEHFTEQFLAEFDLLEVMNNLEETDETGKPFEQY